jgi:tRNA (cytidine/uridine-2'-O-)-methyltransferase
MASSSGARRDASRLAAADPPAGLRVVLVQPEIPPNTGSIARLCAATAIPLHLVRPLGFSLEDRYLKRAGLDYWPFVDLHVHDSWPAFLEAEAPRSLICFSARASRRYLEAPLAGSPVVHLVFGGETRGLDDSLRAAHADALYAIPIFTPHVRSLNLSNAVSIAVYEALRQRGELEK